jgi:protease PrsW
MGKRIKIEFNWKPFLIAFGLLIAVGICLTFTLKDPEFDSLKAKATFEYNTKNYKEAERTWSELIESNPSNIEAHAKLIRAHFSVPKYTRISKHKTEERDDNTIREFYLNISKDSVRSHSDIGFYGLGLINSYLNQYKSALNYYKKVQTKSLPFLNNSMGFLYEQFDSLQLSETYYRREIALNGNLEGAYLNLCELLMTKGNYKEIEQIIADKSTKKFVPKNIKNDMYFITQQYGKYLLQLFYKIGNSINFYGFWAAFFILCTWVIYLRKLDLFEKERWRHILATLALGMIFCFIVWPISDYNNLILQFNLNGGLVNDFIYSVIGIGAIEELAKIIPLFLMLRFTKAINEPFDYIKYASLSALGFAFIENLLYFDEWSYDIFHGRSMLSTVGHMFDTSIIAYGLILNKYKRKKHPVLNFFAFFGLASLAHGFYDYWLINETLSGLSIVSYFVFVSSMYLWVSFKNNALNHSDFFDKDKKHDSENIQAFLIYSLVGILIYEYVAMAFSYGPGLANEKIVASMFSGSYLIFFLAVNFSSIELKQGIWKPLKYWTEKDKNNEDNFDFFEALGKRAYFYVITKNEIAIEILPKYGRLKELINVCDEPDWYLIELENALKLDGYYSNKLLIKTKGSFSLEKEKEKLVALYVIPDDVDLKKEDILRTEFTFCGYAGMKFK